MKILILTNYANGLYLFRKELIENFKNKGYEVFVAVPFDENCQKLKNIGVTLLEVPLERHGMNPLKDLKLFIRYMHIIQKVRADMVLTYTIKPNIYGALAARIKGIPYICNVTGLGMAIENGGVLSKVLFRLYAISMKKAIKVFFQNEKNMKLMNINGIARNNADLLPGSGVNLIDHPYREYPSEQDGINILAVLRIMKDKGIGEYLESVKNVATRYQNIKFILVGEYEDDEKELWEPKIKELVSDEILKYYGHLDTVEPIMEKSHIIVHPSYHEGLSNVLLEAAACGRPVLASEINGCIETFIDNVSGLSFEPKNAEELTNAIIKIISLSSDERRKMGIEGRRWVEKKFDREIVIEKYNEAIQKYG